jgi:uncharacterized membrane protein
MMRIWQATAAFLLLGHVAAASMPANLAVPADGPCQFPEAESLKIIERSVVIQRAPQDVYAYWRDLTNLPEFMQRVQSVEIVDAEFSRWTIKAPLGVQLHWTIQILSESAPHDIAWCARDGARIRHQGIVEVKNSTVSHGTQATLRLRLSPPDPFIRVAMALTGWSIESEVEISLQRLKERLERPENQALSR